MNIQILYGSETGSAEMLCDDLKTEIGDAASTEILDMGEVDPATLDGDSTYLFVTSTYGSGELPMGAQPFLDKLEAGKPDLSQVRFAIFGLGDRVFADTFAKGSEVLMNKLKELGAQQIGERGIHDASSADMPEDIAVPWLQEIMGDMLAKA